MTADSVRGPSVGTGTIQSSDIDAMPPGEQELHTEAHTRHGRSSVLIARRSIVLLYLQHTASVSRGEVSADRCTGRARQPGSDPAGSHAGRRHGANRQPGVGAAAPGRATPTEIGLLKAGIQVATLTTIALWRTGTVGATARYTFLGALPAAALLGHGGGLPRGRRPHVRATIRRRSTPGDELVRWGMRVRRSVGPAS